MLQCTGSQRNYLCFEHPNKRYGVDANFEADLPSALALMVWAHFRRRCYGRGCDELSGGKENRMGYQ
jgi:hypothetical protein